MMARRLALVLAGVFSIGVLTSALMPAPAQAVCRPYCLDLKKHHDKRDADRGDRWERSDRDNHGKRHHYGWAKHLFHKKHKHGGHHGRGGHDDPPVTQPPVTPPPVTPPAVEPPPPPPGPTPCIGC